MNLRGPQHREAGASTPDVVLDVRDLDLTPEVRGLIANVHAQMMSVLAAYDVQTIAEFNEKMAAGTKKEMLAANGDVRRLTRFAEKMRMLWNKHREFGTAFTEQRESLQLAEEAIDGIAVDGMTIADFAREDVPRNLDIYSPVLELYLQRGGIRALDSVLRHIRGSFDRATTAYAETLPEDDGERAQKVFYLLGKFNEPGEARRLSVVLPRHFHPTVMAEFARGVATHDAEAAVGLFADAEGKILASRHDVIRTYVRLAKSRELAGLDPSNILLKAEAVLIGSPHNEYGDLLVEAYGARGDQASLERLEASLPPNDVGVAYSGWDHLAAYYVEHDDVKAAASSIQKANRTTAYRHALAKRAVATRDAAMLADALANTDDAAVITNNEELDAAAFAWARKHLPGRIKRESKQIVGLRYAQALIQEKKYHEVIDFYDRGFDYNRVPWMVARYRLGYKDEARMMYRTSAPWVHEKLEFAACVRDEGDDAAPYIANALALGGVVTSREKVLSLVENGFINEARTFAKTIQEEGEEERAEAWCLIGEWYAQQALKKEMAAQEMLKKLEPSAEDDV